VKLALIYEKRSKNVFLFSDGNGKREQGRVYGEYMYKILERVQEIHPEHVPAAIEVREAVGVARSFRRGANTAAQNAPRSECGQEDVDRNNRWRTVERAKTKQATMNMQQLYTDTRLTLSADPRFSSCL